MGTVVAAASPFVCPPAPAHACSPLQFTTRQLFFLDRVAPASPDASPCKRLSPSRRGRSPKKARKSINIVHNFVLSTLFIVIVLCSVYSLVRRCRSSPVLFSLAPHVLLSIIGH